MWIEKIFQNESRRTSTSTLNINTQKTMFNWNTQNSTYMENLHHYHDQDQTFSLDE